MYSDILNRLKTKDEVVDLLAQVEAALEAFYGSHPLAPEGLEKEFGEAKDKRVFLTDLKKGLESLEALELTLAFRPNQKVLETMSNWVKRNISPSIILDIEVDPSIIGGLIFIYQGTYKDYSVKKDLEAFFRKWKISPSTLIN